MLLEYVEKDLVFNVVCGIADVLVDGTLGAYELDNYSLQMGRISFKLTGQMWSDDIYDRGCLTYTYDVVRWGEVLFDISLFEYAAMTVISNEDLDYFQVEVCHG